MNETPRTTTITTGGITVIAWDRDPEDRCERGTTGCAIDHHASHPDAGCETW